MSSLTGDMLKKAINRLPSMAGYECSVQDGSNTGEYTITFPPELGTVMALLLSLTVCLSLSVSVSVCLSVCHQPDMLDDCSAQDWSNTGECTITFPAELGTVITLLLPLFVSLSLCVSVCLYLCLFVCLSVCLPSTSHA